MPHEPESALCEAYLPLFAIGESSNGRCRSLLHMLDSQTNPEEAALPTGSKYIRELRAGDRRYLRYCLKTFWGVNRTVYGSIFMCSRVGVERFAQVFVPGESMSIISTVVDELRNSSRVAPLNSGHLIEEGVLC